MKTRYYFLLTMTVLAASSASYATTALRMKEAPKSVMQSTSHSQPAAVKQKTPGPAGKPNEGKPIAKPPQVVKPPQAPKPPPPVVKPPETPKPPPQVVKPPQTPKPPPPVANDPVPYFPPVKDDPPPSVNVPEPDTAALFVMALGLLLVFRRVTRPARNSVN